MKRYTFALIIFLVISCFNSYANDCLPDTQAGKPLSMTTVGWEGAKSQWKGFDRYDFVFFPEEQKVGMPGESADGGGLSARIVVPKVALPGNPWVWRARFPDWHTEMDSILLSEGFYIAYINTNNQYGSPVAVAKWNHFYDYLVNQHQLSRKVALEGVSRGGLFIYNWAKQNPDKVSCIYAEAPVCDFKSWPGGFGKGQGSAADWERLKQEYGFASDEEALNYANNPLDNLEELALAKVPVMHMIGLKDEVVPPEENTFLLIDRYVKLGGPATIIPCTRGEQKLFGHHFPIETPELGAQFILQHTELPEKLLDATQYHRLRNGLKNSRIRFEREKKGRVAFLGGSITYNGGWRDSICNYLQTRFPDTDFEFIAAGIPSMGTTPAAFRLERDVLANGPVDLLFEEAAVNDASNGRSDEEQVRAMEGIVRHLRKSNPAIDLVIMHFVDPDKMETYRQGEVPKVIQNHEKVAAHYGISTINLAKEVTDRIDAGEFSWEEDFKNLHPSPFGQQVYYRSVKQLLDRAWSGFVAEDDKLTSYPMPDPIDPDNYGNGKLVAVEKKHQGKGWQFVPSWKPADNKGTRANYVNVPMLVCEKPSGILKWNFEGNIVGIAVAAGPDAGIIEYRIDGGSWQQLDLFTRWSAHLHLPWYYTLATGLEHGKHVLRIRVSAEKNKQSTGNACRIRYFYCSD
ncbi:GDSL-type esterase/lipase family protein [uncultured Sunxiuqinia sp.]|uniref:SGNH/GDSL hydrolase family protein n=1 Tax=uncultured Sunxiuqinia sp. TaxID=1573825 RepID=UPI0026155170|nr:GDSL-type esterase/lipase family protein [uncultured Sunxiuqinia sp.]